MIYNWLRWIEKRKNVSIETKIQKLTFKDKLAYIYGVVSTPIFQFLYVICYFDIQHSMHHAIVTCDMLF